jgi:hypothetical protein
MSHLLLRAKSLLPVLMLLGTSLAIGCHSGVRSSIVQNYPQFISRPPPANCTTWYCPPCFGFNSVCWQPWPEECSTCPSFAAHETINEPGASPKLPTATSEEVPTPPPPRQQQNPLRGPEVRTQDSPN